MTDVERERLIRALNMAVADRDAAIDLLRDVIDGKVSFVFARAFLARVDSDA